MNSVSVFMAFLSVSITCRLHLLLVIYVHQIPFGQSECKVQQVIERGRGWVSEAICACANVSKVGLCTVPHLRTHTHTYDYSDCKHTLVTIRMWVFGERFVLCVYVNVLMLKNIFVQSHTWIHISNDTIATTFY